MDMHTVSSHDAHEFFSTDPTGLVRAQVTPIVDLADGDTYELVAAPVRKRLGDAELRLLAYNGSVPGPTLRVRQGSTVTVTFANRTDMENTVHWHGLRLENRFDGTHQTQAPVPVGGSFSYRIRFPDPGVYWYHPHIREDYGQELGLYGNILVVPNDPDYWPPVHREVALTLDDILLEDGTVASFNRSETTHAAMGRYGNVLLVNGEPDLSLAALRGEVVRFYLTSTANTRVFSVAVPGARIKLVGGDSGRVEQEAFVDSVVLAPSERVVVDVLFETPGTLKLEHHTPERSYALATIDVSTEPATPTLADQFAALRHNPEWVAERQRLAPYFEAPPDKVLALVAEMDMGAPAETAGAVVYACPMHPEVVSPEPGRCPKCGMKLVPLAVSEATSTYACPMHPEIISNEPGRCPKCGMKLVPANVSAVPAGPERHAHYGMQGQGGHGESDTHGHDPHSADRSNAQAGQAHEAGIHAHMPAPHGYAQSTHEQDQQHGRHAEHDQAHLHTQHGGSEQEVHHAHGTPADTGIEWEDEMVAINRMTTQTNMRWKLIDRITGAENHAIDWTFQVGDRVKIRLVNETDSDHPMQHPFHIHGAGRFVVLARDGAVEENLVWKDTVLVRTGQTVDILLDVTNPGVWMAHCHIAEHHESGMMLSFQVVE